VLAEKQEWLDKSAPRQTKIEKVNTNTEKKSTKYLFVITKCFFSSKNCRDLMLSFTFLIFMTNYYIEDFIHLKTCFLIPQYPHISFRKWMVNNLLFLCNVILVTWHSIWNGVNFKNYDWVHNFNFTNARLRICRIIS
jgi:hypothetical protein